MLEVSGEPRSRPLSFLALGLEAIHKQVTVTCIARAEGWGRLGLAVRRSVEYDGLNEGYHTALCGLRVGKVAP